MNKYKEYCEKIIDTIKLFDEYEIKDIINEYLEYTNQYDDTIMDYDDLIDYIEGLDKESILLLGLRSDVNIRNTEYFRIDVYEHLIAIDIEEYFNIYSYEIAEYMIDNENCFYYTALEEIVEDFWKD